MTTRHVIAGVGIALVVGAVIAGLLIIGSPADERIRRLDERRTSELIAIARTVDTYWREHGRLPVSLSELLQEPQARVEIEDPASRQPYPYRVVAGKTYEICAAFDGDDIAPGVSNFWAHERGRRCFQLEAREAP